MAIEDRTFYQEARVVFNKHFRVWYEKHHGSFDAADMKDIERWSDLYSRLWGGDLRGALRSVSSALEKKGPDVE